MKQKYEIIEIHNTDEILVKAYHEYISRIFPSISFKKWHSEGFWTEKYIPHVLIESGIIIANVSAAIIDVIFDGRKCSAVQIGAVGTLPEYRGRGFSRILNDYVSNKYKGTADLIFLFANDSVLKFYPKFGFKLAIESIYVQESNIPKPAFSARKLSIESEVNYFLIKELIRQRSPLTRIFGAENFGFITWWHIFNLYADNLYYLEEEDVIIIKKEKGDSLDIIDVIFCGQIDINSIIPKIIDSNSIKSINYLFPPDQLDFKFDKVKKYDSGLFVMGEFNTRGRPFKYPETAVT